MEDLEQIAFQIITGAGTARSAYMEAVRRAKAGDFDGAGKQIAQGDAAFAEGHRAHAKLLQLEAGDGNVPMGLLLVHAEDHLMGAENFKEIALEFIEVHHQLRELRGKLR